MPTYLTRITHWVETAKICNQSAGFRLWWVGGGLDRNIDVYPPNLTRAHP